VITGTYSRAMTEHRSTVRAHPRRFNLYLASVAALALGLRLVYLFSSRSDPISGDAFFYRSTARFLSEGSELVNPITMEPSALHPPGWPLLMAPLDLMGVDSRFGYQLLAAALGTLTVVLVGRLGLAVADGRVGLVAAGIAAVYPNLWLHERTLLAEVALLPLVAGLLLVVHRHIVGPRLALAAAMGTIIGALALVRPEELMLLAVLAVPVTLYAGRSRLSLIRRWSMCVVAVTAALLVLSPWIAYNAQRFEEPVLLSTNFGNTVRVANCPGTYEGEHIGYVEESCWDRLLLVQGDESEGDAQLRRAGLRYAGEHAQRLPAVLAARQGRTWGVFRPFQQAELDAAFSGSEAGVYVAGTFAYWALVPLAVAGAIALRRRRLLLYAFASFPVVVAVATALTLGQSRIRTAAEVPLVVLAAVGADALVRRRRERSAVARPVEGDRRPGDGPFADGASVDGSSGDEPSELERPELPVPTSVRAAWS
jgi:hypothetical protein